MMYMPIGRITMDTVNVVDARKNLSELMMRVAYSGVRVVVERRGKPMMALVSIADLRRLQAQEEGETTLRERMLSAAESASALRARILASRGGVPIPDSATVVDEMREERDNELSGRS
jgi:prevent-host-death family protein